MVPRKKDTSKYGTQVTKMGLVGIRKGSWSIRLFTWARAGGVQFKLWINCNFEKEPLPFGIQTSITPQKMNKCIHTISECI